MDIKWNANGNWLLTASRDHLLKIFDIRKTKEELQTFRGHKKEVLSVAWHPVHEGIFVSGGSDGSIMFWSVGAEKEIGAIEAAHENNVWALSWHPAGHILCSGSNDHNCKFWTRNRPGDSMRDKYNLNTLPASANESEEVSTGESNAIPMIPGMAPEDRVNPMNFPPPMMETDFSRVPPPTHVNERGNFRVEQEGIHQQQQQQQPQHRQQQEQEEAAKRKMPFSKPIPKSFQNRYVVLFYVNVLFYIGVLDITFETNF